MTETLEDRLVSIYQHYVWVIENDLCLDLDEFFRGGLTTCCIALKIPNPYTGKHFEDEIDGWKIE